jgi:hypothetical protein
LPEISLPGRISESKSHAALQQLPK